jgi:DNA-binding winged helix-turn-helix (wHTH) protein/tetratricopeptide (TPR) repeat protein
MAPKVFDVLKFLVENAGRLVTQQELLEAVWPETFVQPEILRKYILEIRKALGDPPDHPVFIETLPKRGYRFIAPVNHDPVSSTEAGHRIEVDAKVVGREAPIASLRQHLEAASNGQRRVVFVTGEGGIGKTTLIDAFENDAKRISGIRIARGQCVEGFGGKESYYPVLEAFGQLIAGPPGESVIRILAEHAPTWLVQFPAAIRPEQRAALQQEILGATRERMLREAAQAMELLSSAQPLVLILEDLQWVDESTLDLISAIARRRNPARLMVIGTYRPVDVILSANPLKQMKQELLIHRLCSEIAVDPLTEAQVEQFLAAQFPDLPRSLASQIHRRSEGNPMFMVAMLENWRVSPGDAGIPDTLKQLLELQIERLDASDRNLLMAASVAGGRFSAWAGAALLETNAPEVEARCEDLAARHLMLRRAGTQELADGSESPQFEFKHALYREVLYSQLSATHRRRMHARLAEAMESLSSSAEQQFASELALHFEEARSYTRAVRYLILTAANARRRYAHEDSIRLLRHGLELLEHVPPETARDLKIQILERISDALYAQGEMMQSADVDRAVVEQAASHGFIAAQVNSLTRLARALAFMDLGRCVSVCERALELARTQDDPLLTARAEMLAASWRIITHGSRTEDARICAAAREAIRRKEAVPAYYEILYAHVQCIQGDFQGAYETARAGIPKSIENDSLVVYLSAHSALAQALLNLGRFGELLDVVRTALDVAEKNRNAPWVGIFQAHYAWVKLHCGDFEGAREMAEELIREHDTGQIRAMALTAAGFASNDAGLLKPVAEGGGPRFFLDWHWRMIAQFGLSRMSPDRETVDALFAAADAAPDQGWAALAWVAKARQDAAPQLFEKARAAVAGREHQLAAWIVEKVIASAEGRDPDPAMFERLVGSFPPDEPLRETFIRTGGGFV